MRTSELASSPVNFAPDLKNALMITALHRRIASLLLCLSLVSCTEMAYRQMNDPSRNAWQKPKEVIERLAIMPGSRVADLGAGGGYFTWYLAEAVGPQGTVYAVDVDETGLGIIKKEMNARAVRNVVPIHAEPGDAKVPEAVDLVFSCDTYHHMTDRVGYFKSLARYLKEDGRIAILDFHPHGFFSGLLGHGTAQEVVKRYRRTADFTFIDRQHFQIFTRTGS